VTNFFSNHDRLLAEYDHLVSNAPDDSEAGRVRAQVIRQCQAVRRLARQIGSVHQDLASGLGANRPADGVVDQIGSDTAALMRTLTDILGRIPGNGAPRDQWYVNLVAEADRRWPKSP
jgi:hypothetical protein